MARLFPNLDPETITLKPERDVARALVRDLPDDCLIYHSFCWLRRDENGNRETLREGETDFLILDPNFGILILEVKGGDVRHRVRNGHDDYYRVLPGGGERDPGNAFEQARKSMHAITEILQIKDLPDWFGGCFGYAVSFPDQTNRGAIPNDGDTSIVFLAEHLDDMGRAVRGAFKRWNRRKHPSLSSDAMKLCRERLRPVFGLIPARWRELEKDEEQLVTLTTQQQLVLDGLSDNRRLAIRGGAGTGKTMLGLWRAVEYAKEGNDTLFLCFNRQLSQWLNERMDEELDFKTRKRLHINTFHGLCRKFYREAKLPFSPPQDPKQISEFWANAVPNKMFDVLLDEVTHLRFDAIVVDEGQDFRSDWWLVVEALNRETNGRLAIFYDPNQNIFNDDNTLPQTDAVFHLKINCRNTREIHNYSVKKMSADVQSSMRAPAGSPPIEIKVGDGHQQRDRCEALIKSWKSDYRVSADRLAILSHRKLERSCFHTVSRVAGMPITSDLKEWKDGGGVLFSTFAAFKGLEADAVILLTSNSSPPSPGDFYVASSRAKHLLGIIETADC
ncbi:MULTISPECIES: nuclease-related domain-containing DEAD/DEAH box helicase [Pirellulaceae]|nr:MULTISPECIES: NERD domain-containing protein/DEAD/DEAH box helicase [Pirellulaceae]